MLLQDRYEGLKKPEDWLQWFFEAVSPDTEVNQAYIWGKFNFGNDVVNQLNVFADLPDDEQRRAYHRLMTALLSDYDIRHAWMIQKKLVNLEHWWVRLRPFVMWRLLAGTLYGSLVLGGSATWLGMTVAFAAKGWGWILFASLVLIFAPVPCLELIQAPPHVWRRPGRLGRWEFAWVNAVVFAVAICMLQWVLYGWISPARGWEGVSDLRHHVTTTAMASFLGYVVNLFWREKPIFGPE